MVSTYENGAVGAAQWSTHCGGPGFGVYQKQATEVGIWEAVKFTIWVWWLFFPGRGDTNVCLRPVISALHRRHPQLLALTRWFQLELGNPMPPPDPVGTVYTHMQ